MDSPQTHIAWTMAQMAADDAARAEQASPGSEAACNARTAEEDARWAASRVDLAGTTSHEAWRYVRLAEYAAEAARAYADEAVADPWIPEAE